jgi:hypothetical protein
MAKILSTILLILTTYELSAQQAFPDLSPKGIVVQKVGYTTITVQYERPTARGRKIIGELVPYDQLWRTAAGNGTKIKFDKEVTIGQRSIKPGTYSLFTIPGKKEWTIILNSDTTIYGTGGYSESKDVVRVKAIASTTERFYRSFTIDIDITQEDAELNLSWENTRVAFSVKTGTREEIAIMVKEDLLGGKIKDPLVLAMGAEYYYFLNQDLESGLALVNKALEIKNDSWYYSLKVDILSKLERFPEAMETLKIGINYVKTNPEKWDDEQMRSVQENHAIRMKELQGRIKK